MSSKTHSSASSQTNKRQTNDLGIAASFCEKLSESVRVGRVEASIVMKSRGQGITFIHERVNQWSATTHSHISLPNARIFTLLDAACPCCRDVLLPIYSSSFVVCFLSYDKLITNNQSKSMSRSRMKLRTPP